MKLLTTALIFAIAAPTFAGGLVIEDETTEVSPAHERRVSPIVLLILGAALVAAIAGHSDNCNGDDPVTPPNDGGC